MAFFVFLLWLVILTAEGTLFASLLLRRSIRDVFPFLLSLPLAALINVLIVFLCTVVSLPLFFWTLLLGHGIVIAVLLFCIQKRKKFHHEEMYVEAFVPNRWILALRALCILLLSFSAFFSFSHAVILPTFPIDSLTNWTMRSKVSFYDHAMAFDQTEERGVAKPQYPILFHALQITVNEGNTEWNDRSANSIVFCLTLFSFAALFWLLKQQRGFDGALIGLTLITGIPLFGFHLSGGYADVTLVQYLCLSLITLWFWRLHQDAKWMMLSALFMTASVWTKSEALFVGLIPWLFFVIMDGRRTDQRKKIGTSLGAGILLSAFFPIFLLSRGMGLTPHQSDTHFQWHHGALQIAFNGLFSGGSMGISWSVLCIGTILLLWLIFKKDQRIDRSAVSLGLWGLFSLLLILFTYIFTPNAAFLANGESYYRQLMIPAALLMVWLVIVFRPFSLQKVPV